MFDYEILFIFENVDLLSINITEKAKTCMFSLIFLIIRQLHTFQPFNVVSLVRRKTLQHKQYRV